MQISQQFTYKTLLVQQSVLRVEHCLDRLIQAFASGDIEMVEGIKKSINKEIENTLLISSMLAN